MQVSAHPFDLDYAQVCHHKVTLTSVLTLTRLGHNLQASQRCNQMPIIETSRCDSSRSPHLLTVARAYASPGFGQNKTPVDARVAADGQDDLH